MSRALVAALLALVGCATPTLAADGYRHPTLGLHAKASEGTPLSGRTGWSPTLAPDGGLRLTRESSAARIALNAVRLPAALHETGLPALAERWVAGLTAGQLGLQTLAGVPTARRTTYVTTVLDAADGRVAGQPARLVFVDLAEPRTSGTETVRGETQLQVLAALVRGDVGVRRDIGEAVVEEPAVILATLVAPAEELEAEATAFVAFLEALELRPREGTP
ncbi:MAG: hypothetical protein AAGH15_20545 [Myxococcota bacterium]